MHSHPPYTHLHACTRTHTHAHTHPLSLSLSLSLSISLSHTHTLTQTLSDSIPEVARLFSFQITSTSFVRADINASDIDIFVAASDNPHGVVQFAPPLQVDTQEATTTLMLPLQRSFGLVGPLRVNFSVTPNTAQTPEDFNISSECESIGFV